MHRCCRYLLVAVTLSILVAACATRTRRLPNTERTVTRWNDRTKTKKNVNPGSCVEFSTAATKLNTTKVKGEGKAKDITASIDIENAQSLGKIYEVRSIMQFSHAAMFRLCEARRNDDLGPGKYAELFGKTLDAVERLMVNADLTATMRAVEGATVQLVQSEQKYTERAEKADARLYGFKESICGEYEDEGNVGTCQMILGKWAGECYWRKKNKQYSKLKYIDQVKNRFKEVNLRLPKSDFKDSDLMGICKAYEARQGARDQLDRIKKRLETQSDAMDVLRAMQGFIADERKSEKPKADKPKADEATDKAKTKP
jgi:hypothetical protein